MQFFSLKNSAGVTIEFTPRDFYSWGGYSQKEAFNHYCRGDLAVVVGRMDSRYQHHLELFLEEKLSFKKNVQTPLSEHELCDAIFVSYYLAIGLFLDDRPGEAVKGLKKLQEFRKTLAKIDPTLNQRLKDEAVLVLTAFIRKIKSNRFFTNSIEKAERIEQMYRSLQKKLGKGILEEIGLVIS